METTFCTNCNKVGHECKEPINKGPEKVDRVWEPKQKQIKTIPVENTIEENINVEQVQLEVVSSSVQMD